MHRVTLSLVILYFATTSAWALAHFLSPLPIFDTTIIIRFLSFNPTLAELFRYLLEPHNEHRIVFTKLLILIDDYGFGGRKVLPTLAIFVANAAICFLVIKTYWKSIQRARLIWIGSLFTLFFSLAQARNFDSVFQFQFFLVNLFALFAFRTFVEVHPRMQAANLPKEKTPTESHLPFALTLMGSFAAAFNMANGLFVILVVTGSSILFSYKTRFTVVAAVFATFTWWLYFREYTPPHGSEDSAIRFGQLTMVIPYMILFTGNVFKGLLPIPYESAFFGSIGLLACLGFTVTLIRRRNRLTPVDMFTAMVLLFVMMSAGASSLQRLGRGDMLLALVGRYSSLCILFWAVLISWYWGAFENVRWIRSTMMVLVMMGCMSLAVRQWELLTLMLTQGEDRKNAAIALTSDYIGMDEVLLAWPAYEAATIKTLRDRHLSVFSSKEFKSIQQKRRLIVSPDNSAAAQTTPIAAKVSHLQLTAHAFKEEFQLKLEGILPPRTLKGDTFWVLNGAGENVGRARVVRQQSGKSSPWTATPTVGETKWVAYISGQDRIWEAHYFLCEQKIRKEGTRLLALDLEQTPGIPLQHVFDLGTFRPVESEVVEIRQQWMQNGYFEALHPIHPSEQIWGTWSPRLGDANTGAFLFRVKKVAPLKPHERVVLPIIVGPTNGGCELSLLASDEPDAVKRSFELGEMIPDGWNYMDITDLATQRDLLFEIKDSGNQWGQRVAFSMPVVLEIKR